jgi:hypothetical protein
MTALCHASALTADGPRHELTMKHYRIQMLLVFVLGIFFRVVHLTLIDLRLPHGNGGLFFEFSQAIIRGHYAIPDRISYYTQGGIPYAYPPLSFYIEAIIFDLFHPNRYVLVNVLPPALACLSLPVFYWLTLEAFDTRRKRMIALFAYVALPAAINQTLEAGGLAEGMGLVAIIAYAAALLRLIRTRQPRDAILTGILMGVCVLSSPGSAYAAVLLLVAPAFALLSTRPRRGLLLLAMAILVGMVVASPYLLAVIHYHGFQQFTTPFAAQHRGIVTDSIVKFFDFNPADSHLARQWDGLTLLGLIGAVLTRRFTLASWFILLFFVPREGEWLVAMPAALLVTVAVDDILAPALRPLWEQVHQRRIYQTIALVPVCIYVLGGNLATIMNHTRDADLQMEPRHMAALKWAGENLPPDAKLFVLAPLNVIEWTPQIVRRESLNVQFGAEWEPDKYQAIMTFNQNVDECETILCLREQIEAFDASAASPFVMIDAALYPELAADIEEARYNPEYNENQIVVIRFTPQ